MTNRLFICLILIALNLTCHATTWNEPWTEDVIKQATSFVFAKVKSVDKSKGIKIQIIRTLGGIDLKDSISISNFYSLHICSATAGHGADFHLPEDADSCYFFINKNANGEYCIATPTAGIDYITEGNVVATFRHSYHAASAPIGVYEAMMTAVFNNYHNKPYDQAYVNSYVNEWLNKKPAGFSESEINTFFQQHIAMECVYHLKLKVNENKLFGFLNDTANFHNQVSAARALVACNSADSKNELINVIRDSARSHFVQVISIWTLAKMDVKNEKAILKGCLKAASEEGVSFGGDIMDPRICTSMPTVKEALKKLLAKS